MRSIAPSTCASRGCGARSRSTPPIPRQSGRCVGWATCTSRRRTDHKLAERPPLAPCSATLSYRGEWGPPNVGLGSTASCEFRVLSTPRRKCIESGPCLLVWVKRVQHPGHPHQPRRMTMDVQEQTISSTPRREPWNKGKLIGQKPPLRPKHVWSIRTRLQMGGRTRDLAMFNLAIDSKLRGCDVVALRVEDVAPSGYAVDRATVRQKKSQHAGRRRR